MGKCSLGFGREPTDLECHYYLSYGLVFTDHSQEQSFSVSFVNSNVTQNNF